MYADDDNVRYFRSFGVEYTPTKIKSFIGNRHIATNSYTIQANDSIMCGYFCIGFFDCMSEGKSLLDYTSSFFPSEYEENDKIILKYFQ